MKSKFFFALTVGLLMGGSLFSNTAAAQEWWTVSLQATGLSFQAFEFGLRTGATTGWDADGVAAEAPLPPALPNGAISGFNVNGAPFPYMTLADFRPAGTDNAVFRFSYSLADGQTATLDWSAALPGLATELADIEVKDIDGNSVLGAGQTMATVTSVELTPSKDGFGNLFFVLGDVVPSAQDDVAYMLAGTGTLDIDVLDNDYSPSLNVLKVTNVQTPTDQAGAAGVNIDEDGVVYDPDDAFIGVDTFTYTATNLSDGIATSTPATVTVHVNGNLVITPVAGEAGKPGENVDVTVTIDTDAGLAGLALEVVLPRTKENPPTIWGFVSATSDVGVTPTDDGNGTVTLAFDALPTTLTLTLAAADSKALSTPLEFVTAATSVANLTADPLPDALPSVQVPMKYGTLDIDNSADGTAYDSKDVRLILNYINGGKFVDSLMIGGTGYTEDLAAQFRLNIESILSDLDIDNSAGGASYDSKDVRLILNYINGGKFVDSLMIGGTGYTVDQAAGFRSSISQLIDE